MAYTDGSSKKTHCQHIPRVGGVGVFVPASEHCQEVRLSAPLEGERKTNNAAELVAAITGLRLFDTILAKVCIVTDSQYVYWGATGKAAKWRSQGWVGGNGPLSNVNVWVDLLELIEQLGPSAQWLWAPSHVGPRATRWRMGWQ